MTELDINYTNCLRYSLLKSRKIYDRDTETIEVLKNTNIKSYIKACKIEDQIVEAEEVMYKLLHNQISLDMQIQSMIRNNRTNTNEFTEIDCKLIDCCKRLNESMIKYSNLESQLRMILSEVNVLKEHIESLFVS